ncbi:MAG TPA: hypothetical protein VK914_06085 [bacterium]|nr:hypothetical protein [bacterium]
MDRPAQWALVGAAWFLALSVAVFGYLAWQRLERVAPSSPQETAAAAVWAVQSDGTALCPVTGERVSVGPDTPRVTYLGRTYYFSGEKDSSGVDARTRFLMDPESWLQHRPAAP